MFHVKSIEDAIKAIHENYKEYNLSTKKVKVEEALHYIVAKNVISHENVPHFNRSTVDGYACMTSDVQHASSSIPVVLSLLGEVEMGKPSSFQVSSGKTVYVPTGGHLPDGADCVIMIENTEKLHNEIFILNSASPSENIFYKGTDVAIGDIVVQKGKRVTPFAIGALLSLGIEEIEVFEKITVAIISTGTELVSHKKNIDIGEIRDINTELIASYLAQYHVEVVSKIIIKDNIDQYTKAVKDGFHCADLVISSGGSSVGEKDYTIHVLNELGATTYVHGINIKPGKPTIISKYNKKMFLGLPGQPTSAFMVLQSLIKPIIEVIHGSKLSDIKFTVQAKITKNVHSPSGRRFYQLVSLTQDSDVIFATPLFKKSGMIHSLVEADGYIIISEFDEGVYQNDVVTVYRLGD